MKKLFLIIFASMLLMACGSDGGDSAVQWGGTVNITCADASNIDGEICDAAKESRLAALELRTAIYNAGDLGLLTPIYYVIETANTSPYPARFYYELLFDHSVSGCEDHWSSVQSYPLNIPGQSVMILQTGGTIFDLCAQPGPSSATLSLYNATHLGDDDSGNPSIDQLLSRVELKWNFVE